MRPDQDMESKETAGPALELLEQSVVDLKSVGTDRPGTEVTSRSLENNVSFECVFETL